jgi:hypothetical protein
VEVNEIIFRRKNIGLLQHYIFSLRRDLFIRSYFNISLLNKEQPFQGQLGGPLAAHYFWSREMPRFDASPTDGDRATAW